MTMNYFILRLAKTAEELAKARSSAWAPAAHHRRLRLTERLAGSDYRVIQVFATGN
jgi:hypothetical protein